MKFGFLSRRFFALIVMIALVLPLLSGAAQANAPTTITIFHTNDIHSRVTSSDTQIGYARMSTIVQAERAVNPNVLLPDDLIVGPEPGAAQLISAMRSPDESVIAVQEVPWEQANRYGVVSIDSETGLIVGIVEKPQPEVAPSNLAVVGRYLLQPEVFDCLAQITPGAGGELQLTDALALMLKQGHRLRPCRFKGVRYDTGSPLGFLEANIGMALAREDMRAQILVMLQSLTVHGLGEEGAVGSRQE